MKCKKSYLVLLFLLFCVFSVGYTANAQTLSGYFNMYYVKSTNSGTIPQSYTSTLGFNFPTSTYTQLQGSTISQNPSQHQFSVITQAQIAPTFNFTKGNIYTITLNFDTGSYIIPYFPTNNSNWFVSACTNNVCSYQNATTTYTYTIDSTHTSTNTLKLVIKFTASATGSTTITIGNLTDNSGVFYNQFSVQQGIRISSATIDEVEQSIDLSPIIENNNQNTTNIINNNNQNSQNIINSQNETTDAINDINDTLNDDTLPDVINSGGGGGTYFDDINASSDTPISDLLLLPINLILDLKENLSESCSSYTIPFDFTGGNNTLTFPCLNLQNKLGSDLWSIIDGLFSIFMLYNIFNLIVFFYDSWSSASDTFFFMFNPPREPGQQIFDTKFF